MLPKPEASTEGLVARVEALERRNRRLTWLLSTALLLAGSAVAAGSALAPARVIRAQAFLLVDSAGHVEAALRDTAGSPGLRLFNPAGSAVAWLDGNPRKPGLVIHSPQGVEQRAP
jgi:hypothetical protein